MSYLPKETREITFLHSGLKNIFYTSHWIFKWLIWISMVYKISLIKALALLVWIYLMFLEPSWGNVPCYLFTVMAICHSILRRKHGQV